MATAQQLVTRALRRLQAIDINEEPSATEMTHGLAVFSEVLNGWGAKGIPTEDQSLVGDLTSGKDIVKRMDDTGTLVKNLNVSGTGVPANATVKEVITNTSFQLSGNATANGAAATLTFVFLPIAVKYEGAAVALLAIRMKGDWGITLPPELALELERDATDGWASLLAGYTPDRKVQVDRALAPPAGTWDPLTDWIA